MIVVTGATGKLGSHIIQQLVEKVPPSEVVGAVRNPDKAKDLSRLGIELRRADYTKPGTLRSAFEGVAKLLLISSNEAGQRVAQHRAAIDAARSAGVKLIAYTSILRADTSKLALAQEHLWTENYIRSTGIPFVLLRNGWYLENRTESLAPALQHGAILGAAGDGRFSSAARADYARAAVAALTGASQENKIYELAGDTSFTLAEFAAEVSRVAAKPIAYHNLAQNDYEAALLRFGLPPLLAKLLADADAGAQNGELFSDRHDLSALTGTPSTSMTTAVAAALKL